jgi:hypothetical protein
MSLRRFSVTGLLVCAGLLSACSDDPGFAPDDGQIGFDPERPELVEPDPVIPYTGDNLIVRDAQARYATGLDLHRKFILRTCGPDNGVCHNQKEYPNLHTVGGFSATIGAPCNVQPGTWESVFDRCELAGDRFRLGDNGALIEVGWIEYIPGSPPEGDQRTVESPGLHIHLQAPLPGDQRRPWTTGSFVRSFVNNAGQVEEFEFSHFRGQWTVIGDRTHLVADVNDWQVGSVESMLRSGIVQGDMNRNGVYGARLGSTISMLTPSRPEESYLIARVRGYMQGAPIPGTRMPLANQPPNVTDLLALYCFVEQLPPDAKAPDISGPIDYNNCSYINDPMQLDPIGDGATYTDRIGPLLNLHCAGCHGNALAQAGFNLEAEDAFEQLLSTSSQRRDMNLIQPGLPDKSYLWLKLVGDGSVIGTQMPLNSQNQPAPLPADLLAEIETWILAGALR